MEELTQTLNDIFLVNGIFEYEVAKLALEHLRIEAGMNVYEYIQLLDALNNYNIDGHYNNSIIGKNQLAQETDAETS